jgi:hypothetical protein
MPSGPCWYLKVWLCGSYVATYCYTSAKEAYERCADFTSVGCQCSLVEPKAT